MLAIFLLARFVFREQAIDYLTGLEKQRRVELLRAAGPYAADTVQYRFTYKQDTVRAREIREYFRLDTLVNPAATTWDNARALAQFVARNIPHANQKVHPETRNAIGLWEYTRTVEPAFNCRLHSILLHELLALARDRQPLRDVPSGRLARSGLPRGQPRLAARMREMGDDRLRTCNPTSPRPKAKRSHSKRCGGAPSPESRWPYTGFSGTRDPENYLSYWTKNLYWFTCWEQTGYDKEVGYEGRAIALPPRGSRDSRWMNPPSGPPTPTVSGPPRAPAE